MKQVYALSLALLAFSSASFAQFLAVNNNMATNSSLSIVAPTPDSQQWQKEEDRVTGHISSSNLAKMKHVTEAIVGYFHDSCITEGQYSPVWHGEYSSDRAGSGQQMKFSVQCNFYDQKANLTILANDISPLLSHLRINDQDFLTMRPIADQATNCPYFEFSTNRPSDASNASQTGDMSSMRSRVWLINTGNNQLPYIPVSRANYLGEARAELVATRNAVVAYLKKSLPVRSAALQEADKKAAIEQLQTMYSGTNLEVRIRVYLSNHKTDEEYLKENTDKETAGLDHALHIMDSLLNHSTASELSKPAMVSVPAAQFEGFEDDHAGQMLIRLNPAFFTADKNGDRLPLLLVSLQYDPSEPLAAAIDQQMQARFDTQKLMDAVRSLSDAKGQDRAAVPLAF